MFTGKIICLDGDTNEVVAEVDYTPISTSVVSPLWSSASTCDPLKDLKTAMRLVSGACGYSADWIVMGKDVSDAFENADKVLVAASRLQGTLAYAGIVQVDEEASSMHPHEAAGVPLIYYEKGYDFRKVRLSSRPIPIPADTQLWTVLDVI